MESGDMLDLIRRALQAVKGKTGFKELDSATLDGGDDCSLCITTKRRNGKKQDWLIESGDVTEQEPETDAEADRKLEKENQEADDELMMGRASGEH